MGDEEKEKLGSLKLNFLKTLKRQAVDDCIDARLVLLKCSKAGWFYTSCKEEHEAVEKCVRERFEALKEENKKLLEFKINPEIEK